MKKTEMIVKMAQENNLSRKAAQNTYGTVLNAFIEGMTAHGQFVLPGIGTFTVEKVDKVESANDLIKFRPTKTMVAALEK